MCDKFVMLAILPLEILRLVTCYLSSSDLIRVSATCSQIHIKTSHLARDLLPSFWEDLVPDTAFRFFLTLYRKEKFLELYCRLLAFLETSKDNQLLCLMCLRPCADYSDRVLPVFHFNEYRSRKFYCADHMPMSLEAKVSSRTSILFKSLGGHLSGDIAHNIDRYLLGQSYSDYRQTRMITDARRLYGLNADLPFETLGLVVTCINHLPKFKQILDFTGLLGRFLSNFQQEEDPIIMAIIAYKSAGRPGSSRCKSQLVAYQYKPRVIQSLEQQWNDACGHLDDIVMMVRNSPRCKLSCCSLPERPLSSDLHLRI